NKINYHIQKNTDNKDTLQTKLSYVNFPLKRCSRKI
ncbi:hypothetical protein ECPA33_1651, partial [Escherichia coli PA33]